MADGKQVGGRGQKAVAVFSRKAEEPRRTGTGTGNQLEGKCWESLAQRGEESGSERVSDWALNTEGVQEGRQVSLIDLMRWM